MEQGFLSEKKTIYICCTNIRRTGQAYFILEIIIIYIYILLLLLLFSKIQIRYVL